MQDYHIYSHYVSEQSAPKTSPKYEKKQSKTEVFSKSEKQEQKQKTMFSMTPTKAFGTALVIANKINNYVGEYTENTIAARKVTVGLTFAGIGFAMATNPFFGAIALVGYVGNASINYGIKQYKQNLSADYLKDLSGGTVKTGR